MPVIFTPPNTIKRIEEIWMAVSNDGECEGLCAGIINGTLMPLIAADEDRLPWVKEQAKILAAHSGLRIKLIKLTVRIELEDIAR